MNNKVATITGTIVTAVLGSLGIVTPALDNEQGRLALILGLAVSLLTAVTGSVRWFKYGPITIKAEIKVDDKP